VQAGVVATPGDAGTTVIFSGNRFDIEGGTQAGGNLFHKFDAFNVDTGQAANFVGDASVLNIVGQISGRNSSYIDGQVQVQGSDANLYLINPAGVLFGPHAQLSLQGSFTAIAADQVGFNDDWLDVYQTNPDYSSLTADPSAFRFTGSEASAVVNRGNLAVAAGESISLIGGTVLSTGTLEAAGGEIGLVAVEGESTVRFTQPGSLLSLEMTQGDIPINVGGGFAVTDLPALLTGDPRRQANDLQIIADTEGALVSLDGNGVEAGEVAISGALSTRSTTANGGTISLLGRSVNVLSAVVDASGVNGGTIRIGGGMGDSSDLGDSAATLPESDGVLFETLSFSSNAPVIRADGLAGAGGDVFVGGQLAAILNGVISARGTAQGGLVETSSDNLSLSETLTVLTEGSTDNGRWLISSDAMEIVAAGSTYGTIAHGLIERTLDAGTDVEIFTNPAADALNDITLSSSIQQTGSSTAGLTLTGQQFAVQNGSTIDLASTGGLTFNIDVGSTDVTKAQSSRSVEDAIAAIGNITGESTLNLGAGTYDFSAPVSLDTQVNIYGSTIGSTLLRSFGGDHRILSVTADGDVQLRDLILGGGSGFGGGIRNFGDLSVESSRFIGNIDELGGAIFSGDNSNLTVLNSDFVSNGSQDIAIGGSGGAIALLGATATIEGSTFFNNIAADDGGALFIRNSNARISNTNFTNNTSVDDGAGAAVNGSGQTHFVGVTFAGNNANDGGAIAMWDGGQATFDDVTFTGNTAIQAGGAVNLFSSTATFINSRFQDNTALSGGGISAVNSTAVIQESEFERNIASNSGGALRAINTDFSLTDSTFVDNSARQGGGVAAVTPVNAMITNTLFKNNRAQQEGGAIYALSGTTTITDTTLTGNESDGSGGGLALTGGLTEIKNSRIEGNIAGGGGGGLYVINGTARLEASEVDGNQAQDGAGLAVSTGGAGIAVDTTFSNNEAAAQGGGIQIQSGASLDATRITMQGNRALLGGGLANRGTTTLTNTTLSGNSAADQGGAIYSFDSNTQLTLSSSTISNNSAGVSGGGIVERNTQSLDVQNTLVAANTSVSAADVSGTFEDQGNNLIGSAEGSVGFTRSLLVGSAATPLDPELAPLADNGGLTRTHLLQSDSPAINAASPDQTLGMDQRGLARVVGAAMDIGAVEVTAGEVSADILAAIAPNQPPTATPGSSVPNSNPSETSTQPIIETSTQPIIETSNQPVIETSEHSPVTVSSALSDLLLQQISAAEAAETLDIEQNIEQSFQPQTTFEESADNTAIRQLEQTFSQSFADYWDLSLGPDLTFDEVQAILRRAQSEYTVNSAVIYAMFASSDSDASDSEDSASSQSDILQSDILQIEAQPSPSDLLNLSLVMPDGELVSYELPVTRQEVTQQISLFRTMVSDPEDSFGYRPLAQQLYQWLLEPLEDVLAAQNIQNLMYALDAGLRTAPVAAMSDSSGGFALERYGISVVPSIGLMQADFPMPVRRSTIAMGVSEFAQESPLPAVPIELGMIKSFVPASETVLNEFTTLDALQQVQSLDQPGVLHLATHAMFDPYSPESSSILLWEEPLSMAAFSDQDWHGADLELLILSACSTALSSANAELGFAGLAAASGVDATIGSLWQVSDVGTLALMSEFYAQLESHDLRFEALRQAQLSLLNGKTRIENNQLITSRGRIPLPEDWNLPNKAMLDHPFFWSAFTMVGNPW